MADLVLLIGVPGSGKSTAAAQFQRLGHPVVSTDQIRAYLFGDVAVQGSWSLIWQEVEYQFRQVIQQADLVVYDATNARRRGRREVIGLARQIGFRRVLGFWLNPPLALCLERNRQRSRRVPEAVIQRMAQQIRCSPPKLSEGLDLLIHSDDPAFDAADGLAKFNNQYGNRAKHSVRTEPRIC